MFFEDKIQNLKWFDISQIKLAAVASILFILKIWPASMTWVHNTSAWWFLAIFVLASIRPMYIMFKN
tara:strand:- start:362 stop:562 length:201 start_codon:yes stop_codon:yes gene_type:complete